MTWWLSLTQLLEMGGLCLSPTCLPRPMVGAWSIDTCAGYWGIRGIAAPVRMMLWYTGHHDFEDVRYETVCVCTSVCASLSICVNAAFSRHVLAYNKLV